MSIATAEPNRAGELADEELMFGLRLRGAFRIPHGPRLFQGEPSPAWFVSDTAVLNTVDTDGPRITWQSEAFLRFAATVPHGAGRQARDVFGDILLSVGQSGLNLVDERVVERVFGGLLDHGATSLREQRSIYDATLGAKYGESPDSVLRRLKPSQRAAAAIQLQEEMAAAEAKRRARAETVASAEKKRADVAEKKVRELERKQRRRDAKRSRSVSHRKKSKTRRKK